jgi:hypothetical protein
MVSAKPCVGSVHVAHDDSDVLKPQVIAATIERYRATGGWRHELAEGKVLGPQR